MRKINEAYEILSSSLKDKTKTTSKNDYTYKDIYNEHRDEHRDEHIEKIHAQYFKEKESELFQKTFDNFKRKKGFEVYNKQKLSEDGPLGQIIDFLDEETPATPFSEIYEKKDKKINKNKEVKQTKPIKAKVNWKAIASFLIIIYLCGWLITGGIYLTGEAKNNDNYKTLKVLFIFSPMIIVIALTNIFKGQTFNLPQFKFGKSGHYIFIWLLISVFIISSFFLTVLFHRGILDITVSILKGHTEQDFTPQRQFVAYFFLANTFCLILSTFLALGSEYGWRGFLLNELMPLGKTKASIISGIAWGIWYIPLILIGDYSQGYSFIWEPWSGEPPWHAITGTFYQDRILYGIITKIIFCTLFGIILSWVYITSKNILLTCFSYAVFEQMTSLGYVLIREVSPFIGGPEGISGMIVLSIISLSIIFIARWNNFSLNNLNKKTAIGNKQMTSNKTISDEH